MNLTKQEIQDKISMFARIFSRMEKKIYKPYVREIMGNINGIIKRLQSKL